MESLSLTIKRKDFFIDFNGDFKGGNTMPTFIFILALIGVWVISVHEIIRADILENENKELKEKIKSLENEERNLIFYYVPKPWIVKELDNIIDGILTEIEYRPHYPNCVRLLLNLKERI